MYVASLGAGEYFGEMAALGGLPHNTTVEAVADSRLLTLGSDTVKRLADALPDFRARLDERIAQYSYRERAQVPDGVDGRNPAGGRRRAARR